jgi:hypothetical protein
MKNYKDIIERRLGNMRRRHPDGYAQVVSQPFSMPPSYVYDGGDDDPWWSSEEAADFAESIKQSNWHQ